MIDSAIYSNAIALLKEIINIPSHTFNEERVSRYILNYLNSKNRDNSLIIKRVNNNIIAYKKEFKKNCPTLILNSHIDTVEPSASYTIDPHIALEKDGIIYGLGSNDDGASVVSQIATFLYFKEIEDININLILLLSAEEERSGEGGIKRAMEYLNSINIRADFAIIGEPTEMKCAIAERGLLVIDGTTSGTASHVAHPNSNNALYKAIEDISRLKNYKFIKSSPIMGETKLNITQLNSGTAHNIIPDKAHYVIDIRPTDKYNNSEILELLKQEVTHSTLVARNLKNSSSATPTDSPLLKVIENLNIEKYISPTTSDWMKIEIPAIKIGPGDSKRSHKADEYIKISEIIEGIDGYINIIKSI